MLESESFETSTLSTEAFIEKIVKIVVTTETT